MSLKKNPYTKPALKVKHIKINFLFQSERAIDSAENLLYSGEKLLAQSGCGSTCGSGPKDQV